METKVSRRKFLQILGSASAVGMVGCADSAKQNIFPNVKGDETQIPGVASWFSSTCTECTAGCGIKVRVRDGRAVKIEGNVEHPVNRGGICAIGQSSLQELYDPDRIRQPLGRDRTAISDIRDLTATNDIFKSITWDEGFAKITKKLGNKGLFFTKDINGSLEKLVKEFCTKNNLEHIVYDLSNQSDFARACEDTYGTYGIPKLDFSQAEVIVNFGADFLESWISPCEFARDWSDSRRKDHPVKVFHVEPRMSLTAANADKWISIIPGTEIAVARAILMAVAKDAKNKSLGLSVEEASKVSGVSAEKINLLISSLKEVSSSLVLSNSTSENAYELNLIVNLINIELGNLGITINTSAFRKPKSDFVKVKEAIKRMDAGEIESVFIYDVNLDYTLPADLNFRTALNKVAVKENGIVVSFNRKLDETSRLADVILPTSHSLESWGDLIDGDIQSLIQPSMETVFDTQSLGDILLKLSAQETKFYDYIKNNWKTSYKGADFESEFRKYIELGGKFVKSSVSAAYKINPKIYLTKFETAKFSDGEIVIYPYPSVKSFDGGTANRPWMQELPDPITQIAWDSWVEIHPETAKAKGINQGDFVKLDNYSGQLNLPAYVTEHVNPNVVAVPLGQGHSCFGRFAEKVGGGNVLALLASGRSNSHTLVNTKVNLSKGRGVAELAMVQGEVAGSNEQHGRELSRTKYIESEHKEHQNHDDHHHGHEEPIQVYEQRKHPLYQWAMAVDLATCTGCSACVTACYAENNIPTVGKRIMIQGREMAWLRIERYYEKQGEELQVSFLPMMCQHCQNAPCEPVCPVYATYHNEDGINAMIYNRCVGTRYCGNNCSYKVRRFNWFEFEWPTPLDWQLNPDVTKRTAGVMEKCNFCVQRIVAGKDHAKDEGRLVKDGEIQPACVQGCPTKALTFGNLLDPESQVSKLAKDKRAYKVLDHHLNTQPSVSYLENVKYRI